jgi:hypothetical protein
MTHTRDFITLEREPKRNTFRSKDIAGKPRTLTPAVWMYQSSPVTVALQVRRPKEFVTATLLLSEAKKLRDLLDTFIKEMEC